MWIKIGDKTAMLSTLVYASICIHSSSEPGERWNVLNSCRRIVSDHHCRHCRHYFNRSNNAPVLSSVLLAIGGRAETIPLLVLIDTVTRWKAIHHKELNAYRITTEDNYYYVHCETSHPFAAMANAQISARRLPNDKAHPYSSRQQEVNRCAVRKQRQGRARRGCWENAIQR